MLFPVLFILFLCGSQNLNHYATCRTSTLTAPGRRHRHFLGHPTPYYHNSTATFQSSLLLQCGDVETQPGPNNHRTKRHSNLNLLSLNARSLYPKMDLLRALCSVKAYDIISVQESWLNSTINDFEIAMPGYTIFRKDRTQRYGGITVYVQSDIKCSLFDADDQLEESLWLSLQLRSASVTFGTIYFPSPTNSDIESLDNFLNSLSAEAHRNLILCGDFNIDHMPNVTSCLRTKLEACTQSHGLAQLVTKPTRITPTSKTLIDLVYTSDPSIVVSSDVHCPLGKSDHQTVNITFDYRRPVKSVPSREVWRYNRADWITINNEINHLPKSFYDITNVNEAWDNLFKFYMDTLKSHIPRCKIRTQRNTPWLNKELKRLVSKKNRYYKKSRRTGCQRLWMKYKQIRNSLVSELRKAKKDYLDNALSDNLNPQRGWAALRQFTKAFDSYPPVLNHNSISAENNIDKANLFNNYFGSCFVSDSTTSPAASYDISSTLDIWAIIPSEVVKVLKVLPNKSSSGPDGISSIMLKNTADSLACPLSFIFNLSLKTSTVPSAWKVSNVVPLHKKGDRCSVSNYRPISLQPIVSKVMERLIHARLMEHLSDNDILSPHQFGFRPQFSTGEALLSVTGDWFEVLDKHCEVSTLFFDLTKAFDSIPHSVVLQKLHSVGLSNSLCSWFNSYLCNRYQQVVIDGATSQRILVTSGVPQGSVLGPVLFLVAINDLTHLTFSLGTKLALFADDIVLYRTIACTLDFEPVQDDVTMLVDWMDANGLSLNGSKTKFMLLSRKRKSYYSGRQLWLRDAAIERVFEFKYLGVLVSHDLTWSSHISSICSKARRLLGLFYRQFYKVDPNLIFKCYLTIVRPLLDYCCYVWSPHCMKDVKAVENVQYFALKMACKSWNAHYTDLVNDCEIPLLSSRRLYFDGCMVFKILNDLSCIDQDHLVASHRRNQRNQHSLALRTPRIPSSEITRNSFFYRIANSWNALPSSVVSSPSYSNFKIYLKKHLY